MVTDDGVLPQRTTGDLSIVVPEPYKAMDSGVETELLDIWGTADDDFWAVGESGTLLHFDGNAEGQWTTRTSPIPETIYRIHGNGADNIFAVAGETKENSVLIHYDGTDWNLADPQPDSGRLGSSTLYDVWVAPNGVVYVIGTWPGFSTGTAITARLEDGVWKEMCLGPGEESGRVIAGVTDGDVYAGWGFGLGAGIVHYDGNLERCSNVPPEQNPRVGRWRHLDHSATSWLMAFRDNNRNTLFVGGGTRYLREGTELIFQDHTFGMRPAGGWGRSSEYFYAVGSDLESNSGAFAHFNGIQWSSSHILGIDDSTLNDAWGSDSTIIAVGESGTVITLTPFPHDVRYEKFRKANFTAMEQADDLVSGPNADPDGDSIPNAVEYAFQLDPKTAETSSVFTMSLLTLEEQEVLALAYPSTEGLPDISITYSDSVNLHDWFSVEPMETLIQNDTVEVFFSIPQNLNSGYFIRPEIHLN